MSNLCSKGENNKNLLVNSGFPECIPDINVIFFNISNKLFFILVIVKYYWQGSNILIRNKCYVRMSIGFLAK